MSKKIYRTNPIGTRHGNSKLDERKVEQIRELRRRGLSLRKIAQQFEVTNSYIHKICNHQRWKHL